VTGRGRAALLAAAIALPGAARAQTPEDFYRSHAINWVLSAGAGGGYSTYAQAFAPFWSAHLPGRPGITVQNMPGAGGIRAMQYFYANAPRDGSVVGLVHSSVPFAPLFDLPGSKFDSRKFNWIGSLNSETELCIAWHTAGLKTWDDLKAKTFLVGGTGGGSQMETLPESINRMFGTKMKIISGYNSGNDVYLAMERGEVQGRCSVGASSVNATRPDWFAKKLVDVPLVIGLKRDPLFPDTPSLYEHATDDRTRQILTALLAYEDMERPVLAPPGVPADRLAALKLAFHEAMNDPGFIAEAKRLRLDIFELSGDKVAKIMDDAYALPPDVLKAAKDMMTFDAGPAQ
jgi:tripartite-type tricarboxylate transporter receptor subunit TctC